MTDITELAQRMKAAAEKATPGPWYVHDKPCEDGNYGIDTSDKEFLAEAVVWWGFARQSIWREEDAKYIALANPANVRALVEALEKAQQERDNWRTTFDNERFRADKLKAHIDEMTEERNASINELSRIIQKEVKAKRETEQRIAELESRTVKLPAERFCPAEYAGSQLWSETEVWNKAITTCADALRAAGIKVEAE
ncbi:ead/Ea22-like family protein [Klebsiella pneumoniae]|uniref:ead/Ea22-like family protein n=2 Tax=Klebsiella pneumoniae TaxID=573 RepID=UPI000A250966|nr:ead/Ea22-like family protein [Klebsiella pneumoniae]MCD1501502.1 ead/Ea22-like family protein [Klebsiella pneumoniae]MCD8655448.1 ead/Ea22-like family protein [Klebsiella pneumoniae]MCD9603143.1 ead/Ea22-like family protein [Klebsiella pneumoniae]MCK0998759.1 ead/Ea22-like family protein [Klebsiella pneumoniae]MDA5466688.1 ead/Ea22-like family protein [Klebsiella pneumoniae]